MLALLLALVIGQAQREPDYPGTSTYKGVEVTIDLPDGLALVRDKDGKITIAPGQRVPNFGAPIDNRGLCVFASLDMAARWQRVPQLIGIIHRIDRGGGSPSKVERIVAQFAPGVEVAQYEGDNLDFLELGLKTSRAVCVTYGYGKLYNYRTIAHMVLLTHLDKDYAAIIDNNDVECHTWMSRAEFHRRFIHPRGRGWAFVLITPPPPPPPSNLKRLSSIAPIGPAFLGNRKTKVA